MFREIIGGLLVVLILITGFFSYIILFEVKEIRSPSLTLNKAQYETEPDFQTSGYENKFKQPFKNSIEEQEKWGQSQEDINEEYDVILEAALYNQKLLFIEEYNNDIEAKNEELKTDFQNYRKKVDTLTERKIDYYSSMVRYEKEKSFENLQSKYGEKLKEFEKEVQKERSNEIINYRLKLETLDLTEAKKKEYRVKLEEIRSAKRVKINNKSTEIYYQLRIENNKLKKAMEDKIVELTEKFEEEKKELISKKNHELESIFSVYQRNRHTALNQKIKVFETNINEERQAILDKRENFIEIAKRDLKTLKNRYNVSNGERK